MQIFAETRRLILREIVPTDESSLFIMDSDAEVHRFLGNNPVSEIGQARKMIDHIRQQYQDTVIGRWAVIEKDGHQFVGWAGLKFINQPVNNHVNYYDLGYRLARAFWNRGYATEAARAVLTYAYQSMLLSHVYAMAMRITFSRKMC